MIDQNTLRINFRIFKFRMFAAEGDCAHAQLLALALYGNASITGFPLIVVGLIIDL